MKKIVLLLLLTNMGALASASAQILFEKDPAEADITRVKISKSDSVQPGYPNQIYYSHSSHILAGNTEFVFNTRMGPPPVQQAYAETTYLSFEIFDQDAEGAVSVELRDSNDRSIVSENCVQGARNICLITLAMRHTSANPAPGFLNRYLNSSNNTVSYSAIAGSYKIVVNYGYAKRIFNFRAVNQLPF